MRPSSLLACSLVAALTGDLATAFTAPLGNAAGQNLVLALNAHTRGDASSPLDRADFLKISLASIAAISFTPSIASADDSIDDLAMPSADEQKEAEVSSLLFLAIDWISRVPCFAACTTPPKTRHYKLH